MTKDNTVQFQQHKRNLDLDLLSAIIDEVPLPIFVKDANSVFVLSNRRHAELIGIKESELLGQTTAALHGVEEAQKSRERDLPVLETGQQSLVQRDYAYPNGNTCFLETRKTRLLDKNGQHYVLGVNIDLTNIRQKEEHLRSLTEAVPVGIVEIDGTGEVHGANKLALKLLSGEEELSNLQAAKRLFDPLGPSFPGEERSYRLNLVFDAGNVTRHLLVSSTGWTTLPHSTHRMALVSIADVSEIIDLRRQNEQITSLNVELAKAVSNLKLAQDELVKKGKLEQLGQLTATVAHELRNPLAAVRTSAFLLERKLKSEHPEFTKQFERIANGIKRCDDIITQLLDFTRSKTLLLTAQDLDGWLAKLVEEQAGGLPSKLSIECTLGLNGELVAFDADRLSRAVINVVQNASEAIFEQGHSANGARSATHIWMSTNLSGRGVELRIRDSGPGIPPDVLARIREPLFTTKNFGTGLGVPAVEKIMEQHAGGLEITSTIGEGTLVTLWWPGKMAEVSDRL
jgi:PAS domain S-box-containing protein